MDQAQLNDMIEQATEQEKRQHKQWINHYLGSKLSKKMASAQRQIEAGLTETQTERNLNKKGN